jgi:hypothetical protein
MSPSSNNDNITLDSDVDLDLMAFYKTKTGQPGGLFQTGIRVDQWKFE